MLKKSKKSDFIYIRIYTSKNSINNQELFCVALQIIFFSIFRNDCPKVNILKLEFFSKFQSLLTF